MSGGKLVCLFWMPKPLNASFMYLLSGLTVDPHTKKVKRYVGHSFMAIDDLKFIAYISIINEKKQNYSWIWKYVG